MGEVITFYSFKGGVGRTMALANVATLLSQWDYKVLMVDWDLHAPGLEYFFQEYIAGFDPETGVQQEGILDLIERVKNGDLPPTELPDLENIIISVNVPKGKTPLHLITAGKRDDEYFKKISQLDLGEFYAQQDGGDFIETLRSHWKETYDFVLIDSRTGISDVGGVCTIQLPDLLVVFLTATAQSLKGTLDVVRKAKEARQYLPVDRLNLLTLAVPTRFDGQVRASMPEEWLQKFVTKLAAFYENWLPPAVDRLDFLRAIRIPYTPHYSFGEQLPVLEKEIAVDPGGVKEAYENVAALMANKLEAIEQFMSNREDYVRITSKTAEITSRATPLPAKINVRIVEFFSSLPNISDSDGQRALLWSAGLDVQLQNQIKFTASPVQFSQMLVSMLARYGKLADGRDALTAMLETAKMFVGADKRDDCDRLIKELGEVQQEERIVYSAGQFDLLATDHVALQKAYLNRLIETCGQVMLSGIDRKAARDQESCLKLSGIYTALLTLSTEHTQETHPLPLPGGEADERQQRRLSAVEQLNTYKRLVLLGDPGSGKSTFVNFVTLCLAGEHVGSSQANLHLLTVPLPQEKKDNNKEAPPQMWDHGALLPVRIILRDFAAEGLPPVGEPATSRHLWEFIVKTLHEASLEAYAPLLQQHLLTQGGLILLDGLDDVPEAYARRAQIKQAVEDFVRSFHRCRFVVTSRTYAYQRQDWQLMGFTETVIVPFTAPQIIRFVEQWYAQSAALLGMRTADAASRADALKRAILTSDRLTGFAERPLLLTLMASLHAWRGGSLPEKREELYNDAVELLLDWWESRKVKSADGQFVSLSEALNIGREGLNGLRSTISKLAYEAHAAQPDLVGTADIPGEKLAGALRQLSRQTAINPHAIEDYLRDRAGLLVAHGVDVYTFPHRTFQEYLAAWWLTEDQNNYPDNIAELARREPNRWREVVLLAGAKAARGAPGSIWLLTDALCYRPVVNADRFSVLQDVYGALFAAQALIENTDVTHISPRLRPKVDLIRDWLAAILSEQQPAGVPLPAVERALAGNLLAQLGDPRPGVGLRPDGVPDILWLEIHAGPFTMGSNKKEDSRTYSDEQPQYMVNVPTFQISRYPVTNAQYQSFVNDGGYTKKWRECWTPEGWKWKEQENISDPHRFGEIFDLPNHPVVGVSWHEAVAYCKWLTIRLQKTGELSEGTIIRLPTEAEWEKVVRGNGEQIYPWGNEITPEHANYTETGLGVTSAVGCFPRGQTSFGCEDMAGNIWEWCQDVWHDNYKGASNNGRAWEQGGNPDLRVLRGGAWDSASRDCRCAVRLAHTRGSRFNNVGFRVVYVTESKS